MNERPGDDTGSDAPVVGYTVYDTGAVVRLYRVVRGMVVTTEDFLSQKTLWERRPPERRRPPPTTRHLQAIWDGISVSATHALAAQQRARNPRIGNYVAILEVPVIQLPMQRSTETQGHFTLWGTPRELLTLTLTVLPMPQKGRQMTTQWELWDDESSNLIWTYRTEADALEQVREYMRETSGAAVIGVSLVRSVNGTGAVIASDEALATRARAIVAARAVAD